MKRHISGLFISCILFLHLNAARGAPSRYAIAPSGAKPTSLYKAPSHYGKAVPLQSFIITSRPISFHADNNKQEGNSIKSPLVQTISKTSLTSVPGVATVVCKGISCASSAMSFSDWPSEDDGFAGEAIPVDEGSYMTAMVGQHQPEVVVPVPSVPKFKEGSAQSIVHLLTNRPYLRRGASKRKTPAPTRKTYVERRSTRATTRSTTRRLPVTLAQQATTPKPAPSTVRSPTITFQRPSMIFPAMAAFGLMALPVAAAAVPLLLQGRRKRRALGPPSLDDGSLFPDMDFWELMRDLEDLENGNERMAQPDGQRHVAKVTKARLRLQKINSGKMRRK